MREYMGHVLPESLAQVVEPSRTALLIVDMQNDFVHPEGYCAQSLGAAGIAGFREAIEPIKRLAAAARGAGVAVFYPRVVQLPDGSLSSPVWIEDGLRYGLEPRQCMRGTWGYEIIEELAPQAGDVVFDKTRRTAFQGSVLENLLRVRGIQSVVVTGVAASGCVESTVRDAIERDLFAVVPADAMANSSAADTEACYPMFRHLLGNQRFTSVDELIGIWAGN